MRLGVGEPPHGVGVGARWSDVIYGRVGWFDSLNASKTSAVSDIDLHDQSTLIVSLMRQWNYGKRTSV